MRHPAPAAVFACRTRRPSPAGARNPATLFAGHKTHLQLWQTLYTGFYPRIHDQHIPPAIWLPDYVQTYLERDVRALVNIGNMATFERFLALCAGRVGQVLNCAALASDCGIAVDTAQRWISVLKTSFVVFLLPPHHRNFNKRLIKSPKLYFYDTGLACYLLGIKDPQMLPTHPLRGPLFENYQVAEVAKAFHHHRQKPLLYFGATALATRSIYWWNGARRSTRLRSSLDKRSAPMRSPHLHGGAAPPDRTLRLLR